LQAELKREVPRDEIDSGVMATFIQLWRMAVQRREVAEASLGKALEDRRRANDVNAQLRAQLQEAATQLREQALELEVMRGKESDEAAFRETHPGLAALVERHTRPSGIWSQNLMQGYAMMSFLGQHKYDQVRHFNGDLAGLKLADTGLDGSPDSLRAVCELLGKVVTQYAEGLVDCGDITFPLSLDANATMQHVGVGRDGHVTWLIRGGSIDLDRAEAICSDPAELNGFVGERVLARDVAGWLFVS
jgi:hypothetical protein